MKRCLAALADRFVCIADASKLVDVLGAFPSPVEVIPMAGARIVRQFAALGGRAVLRSMRLKNPMFSSRAAAAHARKALPRYQRVRVGQGSRYAQGQQPVLGERDAAWFSDRVVHPVSPVCVPMACA